LAWLTVGIAQPLVIDIAGAWRRTESGGREQGKHRTRDDPTHDAPWFARVLAAG
jgi:hypothetical protein